MVFERWGYQIDGTYLSPDLLEQIAGVYIIWCEYRGIWSVLDVGEATDVRARVSNHDRSTCWKQNCIGQIHYSAIYTPNIQQAGRMEIEQKIRSLEPVACGKR
jgi:hypothetical protein